MIKSNSCRELFLRVDEHEVNRQLIIPPSNVLEFLSFFDDEREQIFKFLVGKLLLKWFVRVGNERENTRHNLVYWSIDRVLHLPMFLRRVR